MRLVLTQLTMGANVLALVALLGTPLYCFVSLFLFDAPGSRRNPLVILAALAVWLNPIAAGLGGYKALKSYRLGEIREMYSWTCLTYSCVFVFFAVTLLASALETWPRE